MANLTKDQIYDKIVELAKKKIIRSVTVQGNMPGIRWTVEGYGFTTRCYTTHEICIFIEAANEGYLAATIEREMNGS